MKYGASYGYLIDYGLLETPILRSKNVSSSDRRHQIKISCSIAPQKNQLEQHQLILTKSNGFAQTMRNKQ